MVGSLDLFGLGDNRIAVFDWTGLSNLNNMGRGDNFGDRRSGIMFGGQILTTQVSYLDEGAACLATTGSTIIPSSFCGLGQQKAGLIPLGNTCVANNLNGSDVSSCPESGIATNGDGTTQASYANGELWTAVSTQMVQTFGAKSETHIGATYWGVNTQGRTFSVSSEGYVTASHADIEFPAIAATDAGSALMSFTLSGQQYYPSSAYTWLTPDSGVIHVTALGQAPQDGFTEYQGYTTAAGSLTTRPRWGDYGAAIFVPSGDGSGKIYFSTEYIQSPNCNTLATNGPSCGGTRTTFANWGSSINFVGVSTDRQR